VTAGPSAFRVHVGDQVLAALAEAGHPLSTPEIQRRTGYGIRHGQLVYQVLTRLAGAGEVEKLGGVKPVYWRRVRPQVAVPPMKVRGDRDGRRPS
jgi:hypothetical protein